MAQPRKRKIVSTPEPRLAPRGEPGLDEALSEVKEPRPRREPADNSADFADDRVDEYGMQIEEGGGAGGRFKTPQGMLSQLLLMVGIAVLVVGIMALTPLGGYFGLLDKSDIAGVADGRIITATNVLKADVAGLKTGLGNLEDSILDESLLAGYVTTSSLANQLSGFVGNAELTAAVADLATDADLAGFAGKAALDAAESRIDGLEGLAGDILDAVDAELDERLAGIGDAVVPLPCRFYGDVTIGGVAAPTGTVVTALVGGDTYTTTTTSLDYALKIIPGRQYSDTTPITFLVNGHLAGQTGVWTEGGNLVLDLTAEAQALVTGSQGLTYSLSGSANNYTLTITSDEAGSFVGVVTAVYRTPRPVLVGVAYEDALIDFYGKLSSNDRAYTPEMSPTLLWDAVALEWTVTAWSLKEVSFPTLRFTLVAGVEASLPMTVNGLNAFPLYDIYIDVLPATSETGGAPSGGI